MSRQQMLFGGKPRSTLLNGLQVYYKLEDLTDSSGNGLTLTNNNTVTFGAGKVGNAATFVSTSSQYLSRADAAQFQMGTGDFSVSCWTKFSTSSNQNVVIYGNTGSTGYGIQNNSAGLRGGISDGSVNSFTSTIHAFNDNNWHLVIITCSRNAGAGTGTLICYVDNTTEDTKNFSSLFNAVNNSNGFNVGAMQASGFFDGSVDEVGVWSRVLTGTELTALWNGGAGVTYPFS